MIYIKLDDSMNLVITVNEPIYRGDNLNQKIIYLIPLQVGEIDMLTATPYLSYIRADGVADIVRLERQSEKYKEAYYQYVFPVSCRLTKFPGEVCSWLQIFSGTPSNPRDSLIITSDSKESELYFYDANGELKNISERKQFETLTEAQAWVKTYDCAGHIISVHNGSDWVPYIVSADGKLSPVNAGDISVGDVKVIDGGAANGIQ